MDRRMFLGLPLAGFLNLKREEKEKKKNIFKHVGVVFYRDEEGKIFCDLL